MVRVLRHDESESMMEWGDILTQTRVSDWNGKTYTKFVPVGAENIRVNPDGTYTIRVNDLRVLIDNLRGTGESFRKIKLEPSPYLNDIQGYNSIVLYRGWFCRVYSCGGAIICTEQEAYDRGYIR